VAYLVFCFSLIVIAPAYDSTTVPSTTLFRYRGCSRIGRTGNDLLQGKDQLGRDDHRINILVRLGAMTTFTLYRDKNFVAGSHKPSSFDPDFTAFQLGRYMQTNNTTYIFT